MAMFKYHLLSMKKIICYSKPSKHYYIQTMRARVLQFCENVHPPPHVTCQVYCVRGRVSGVRFHLSRVRCHVYFSCRIFLCFAFSGKLVGLVGGGSGINGAYPI